jgi:hypothetical protein
MQKHWQVVTAYYIDNPVSAAKETETTRVAFSIPDRRL